MFYMQYNSGFSYFQKLCNSKLRQILWPIRASELRKFFLMALLMFAVLLNQNIVRAIKNTIVTTQIGAESISFIKFWGEMPVGFLFILFYSKLCNAVTAEKAFRIIVFSFFLFFVTYSFIILPNHKFFYPNPETIELYTLQFPHLKWFIKMWGHWGDVLFYIIGELWPIVVFSLLYWQLANKITTTEEATHFYPFLTLFGQSNLLLSGNIVVYFSRENHIFIKLFSSELTTDEILIKSLMIIVILSTIIILLLHRFIETRIVHSFMSNKASLNQCFKMNLKESIKVILSSRYLWQICCMIISYSVVINIIEGVWMSKIQELYSTTEQFMTYQGTILIYTGISSIICSFLSCSIIRYLGWYYGAVITPVIILVVGTCFFFSIALENYLESIIHCVSSLSIIVLIGTIQNVLAKGVKYSIFDATKEMAYIPLDDEIKTKGKAAVEVAGAKIGKAVSSIMQFSIFSIMPFIKYDDIIIFLTILFIIVCIFWILNVKFLHKNYIALLISDNKKKHRI
ncbi:TLC ATP/ADP transporter family protein [Orientia chuto str. Dubai]|uniref:ADP,ATP carrier protein n=1 Tax=Orientia chuto str. Dubai TaxID=1359168 RepID=A0A0F3MMX0_9RICK|nr:NTP/NDP exchange transporter [Candidatus Orientia mediorientalis]KJV57103.1 TLC ATP/ADP transporter family protein [Orientia chuto str. Dubai]